MSNKSGEIGLGSILFWGFIAYNCFFSGGDEDSTKVEVAVDDKPSVTEEVSKTISDVKPELEKAVMQAKQAFNDVVSKTKEVEKEISESKESDDIYATVESSDDKFSRTENLY